MTPCEQCSFSAATAAQRVGAHGGGVDDRDERRRDDVVDFQVVGQYPEGGSREEPAGNQELDVGMRTRVALLRDLRCQGERGFALLAQRWAVLHHITVSPGRITEIARAVLVLTQFEYKYIR